MKSTQYSEKTLDHFRNPRNVGTLEGDDVAVGRVGNPVCGDLMEMYVRIKDDRIDDIKFQTFGCGSAVATSSMITELVMGMTLDEALEVTRADVADALDGLPPDQDALLEPGRRCAARRDQELACGHPARAPGAEEIAVDRRGLRRAGGHRHRGGRRSTPARASTPQSDDVAELDRQAGARARQGSGLRPARPRR